MPFVIKIIFVALGGLFVSALALLHPVGPALMVFGISPFDPLMTNFFGMAGNYITIIPIMIILVKVGPSRWVETFLGTRVQRALLLFFAVVSVAYLIGYLRVGPGAFFAYLQKLSGFALVGLLATGLRNERYIDFCLKLLAVSMALFALVCMLEFYLGIQLFPTQSDFGAGGLVDAERTENVHEARLRGAGNSVSINRFALQLLVPIGLSMGWLATKNRRGLIVIPLVCLIVLLTALFGTISRSGLLSLAIGAVVVSVSAYRLNPKSVFALLILAGVLAFGASQVLGYFELGDEFESRLSTSDLNFGSSVRQSAWLHGLKLFADSPIWGVGYGVIETDNVRWTLTSRDPHNAYVRVLAYAGVIGGSFFAYLLWTIFSTLAKSSMRAGDRVEYWRPYFMAGFASLLVMNIFNSYFFDRYMFIIIGFAAALEQSRRDAAYPATRSIEVNPEPKTLDDWSTRNPASPSG